MWHAKRLTMDNRQNPEYHVVAAMRTLWNWPIRKHLDLSFIWCHYHCASGGRSISQPIASLSAAPCWRDPTRSKQPSMLAILGYYFGLYHVIVPLSFLRSNQTCFIAMFLFIGWSDLLQILRTPAAFSFAVSCIIVFNHNHACNRQNKATSWNFER